ncbi:MAG: NAD-dependent epimerase/dehydratase family protein [Acidimicrobiia bacterium]
MRVLLTGAFGNVGTSVLREIDGRGHDVVCFDVATRANRKRAAAAGAGAHWGDIRDPGAVEHAMAGCGAVIHLAAIIPPGSDRNPALAEAVNVGGTANVIAAARAHGGVRIVFASSLALFGRTQHLPPPRTLDDPVVVTDPYTAHKAACEEMLRESALDVAILRFGAVLPLQVLGSIDPIMFEVPLSDRIEFVHTYDVGLALVNALEQEEVWGRTLLIGGGPSCQLYQRELITRGLAASGLGMLPESAFSTTPYHTDWLDTAESQRLLEFQRHTFDDYLAHLIPVLGWRRHAARVLRPLVCRWMLRQSPYYVPSGRASH